METANDLMLLKAEGRFATVPMAASRGVKLGGTVAAVGFPNVGLQGFAPKLAKGETASLSGAQDDARYFQINVRVQPGNSGVALVDEHERDAQLSPPHTNCSFVVAASASQPRVGLLEIEPTSLIEICRPRVFGLFTSISFGSHVCWLIFWCGAGL